jgi:hypothetical protein
VGGGGNSFSVHDSHIIATLLVFTQKTSETRDILSVTIYFNANLNKYVTEQRQSACVTAIQDALLMQSKCVYVCSADPHQAPPCYTWYSHSTSHSRTEHGNSFYTVHFTIFPHLETAGENHHDHMSAGRPPLPPPT